MSKIEKTEKQLLKTMEENIRKNMKKLKVPLFLKSGTQGQQQDEIRESLLFIISLAMPFDI